MNAAVGLGIYADYEEARRRMTRSAKVFQPIPQNVKLYNRLYKEVYLKMYGRLKPVYQKIREITGYPQ